MPRKDPDARFQSARDLAFALDTAAEMATPTSTAVALPGSSTGALAGPGRHRSRRHWRRRLCDLAAPAFTCSADTRAGALRAPAAAGHAVRGRPVISPDGRWLSFPPARARPTAAVFLRRLDQLPTTELPGTKGGQRVLSPDGNRSPSWQTKAEANRLDGTASPVIVCTVESFLGGTWTADGTIVFASTNKGLAAGRLGDGGVPRPLSVVEPIPVSFGDRKPSCAGDAAWRPRDVGHRSPRRRRFRIEC